MGINAVIKTLDTPVVKPDYLDLDFQFFFTTQLKKFLGSYQYPLREKLRATPNPNEAIVRII